MLFRKKSAYVKYANRRMSLAKRRRYFTIGGIALAVIIVAVGIYFLANIKPATPVIYGGMEEASLPTITCRYKDRQINRLYGYASPMNRSYMRDTIFVLQDTYDMELSIEGGKTKISAAEFRIYDFEEDNLVQDTDITHTLKDNGSYVSANLTVEPLIDDGREYDVEITLTTQTGNDIHYYTRLIRTGAPFLEKSLTLVEDLHNATYDYNKTDELFSPYKSDNDYLYDESVSFNKVTLQSTISHLSWSDMQVKETVAPTINIVDIDGDLGFFKVDYQVGRNLTENNPQHYNVSEYFRTRINATDTYLLDYERTTEQIFLPSSELVSADHINLGITNDTSIESLCSPDGNHVAFVPNKSLWLMSADTKELTSVFDFNSDIADVRDIYDQHNIKVVDVTNEGDVRFLVYGYMNRGLHEGMSGIGLYSFSFQDLKVEEEAFIPADIPYQVLSYSISNLCYMNSTGGLFILINDTLYSIDGSTNSASPVVTDLVADTYKVSEDNRVLSWQAENKVNDANTIVTLDMETMKTYEVKADPGKSIKIMGFLNDDLLYGQGDTGMIYKDANDVEHLLMTHLYAVDQSGRRQNENTEEGYYFISADQEYNRIIAKRVVGHDGEYFEAEDFTVFATDMSDYPETSTYTATEEIRKQVLLMSFPKNNIASAPLNIILSTSVVFSSERVSDIGDMVGDEWNYLVYAKGRLIDLENNPAAAVMTAYDNTGCVINKDGTYFYRRGMRSTTAEVDEKDAEAAKEAYLNETAVNITGIELPQALTFLARRIPLIWENGEDAFVVTGYTASDALVLKNIKTGETSYLSSNDANRIFTTAGRCFIYEP